MSIAAAVWSLRGPVAPLRSRRLLLPVTALLLLAAVRPSSAQAVVSGGINLGNLNIGTYTNTTNAANAGVKITGDFTASANPATQSVMQALFPQGLTYMQTVTFNFASGNQQLIFTRNDAGNVGTPLTGTFPDPPQNGYRYADGTTGLVGDNTPWYSTITPTAGAVQPPNSFLDGATPHQFMDTPSIPFGVFGGQSGLTALLANQNGTITFEAALVGVSAVPANLVTGTYNATVLSDFTWGLNFANTGPNTYNTTLLGGAAPTVTAGPSAAFVSAFNRGGPQGVATWNVAFTPEPGAACQLLAAGLAGAGLLSRRRAGRRAHSRTCV